MKSLHTFVICAYKESPFLEQCIVSLKKQKKESTMLLITSTPCEFISRICEKYDIPVAVNHGESGITQDWNFGLKQVKTRYATLAHQDDIYEPEYSTKIIAMMEKYQDSIIAFSDYAELRGQEKTTDNQLLRIKKLMLFPLKARWTWGSRFIRRRVLSFGDPICCPAVTFDLEHVQRPAFCHTFQSCEDWECWEKLSRQRGKFIYLSQPLMCHRIHQESATTAIIQDNKRVEENYTMYRKFWPPFIARAINRFYTKSENSNSLQ